MRPKLWMLGQLLEEGATAVQGSLGQGLNAIEVAQPGWLWIGEERMVEPVLELKSSGHGNMAQHAMCWEKGTYSKLGPVSTPHKPSSLAESQSQICWLPLVLLLFL